MKKAYTDFNQANILAKILPKGSADMCYPFPYEEGDKPLLEQGGFSIPCWSLAALLEEIPDKLITDDETYYNLAISKENCQYYLYYYDIWGDVEDIETGYYDDFVDACVEMIIKLHELKLL